MAADGSARRHRQFVASGREGQDQTSSFVLGTSGVGGIGQVPDKRDSRPRGKNRQTGHVARQTRSRTRDGRETAHYRGTKTLRTRQGAFPDQLRSLSSASRNGTGRPRAAAGGFQVGAWLAAKARPHRAAWFARTHQRQRQNVSTRHAGTGGFR